MPRILTLAAGNSMAPLTIGLAVMNAMRRDKSRTSLPVAIGPVFRAELESLRLVSADKLLGKLGSSES